MCPSKGVIFYFCSGKCEGVAGVEGRERTVKKQSLVVMSFSQTPVKLPSNQTTGQSDE